MHFGEFVCHVIGDDAGVTRTPPKGDVAFKGREEDVSCH